MTHQKRLGEWGETQARRYLETMGYVFIERNFQVHDGEIDLVMQDGDIVVFVEVKTRTSDSFGTPEESVSRAKRQRLQFAAWSFLQEREMLDSSWRIDFVAIEATPNRTIQRMDHYPSAFDIELNSL
ncbi:MAG: YraN family protein [Anaerolineales bacterium]|nr:YraN family protein [Anaerolineales bacterium]